MQERQLRMEFAATGSDFRERGQLGAGTAQEEVCSTRRRLSEAVMAEDWVCSHKTRGDFRGRGWPKTGLAAPRSDFRVRGWLGLCSPRGRLSSAGPARGGDLQPMEAAFGSKDSDVGRCSDFVLE